MKRRFIRFLIISLTSVVFSTTCFAQLTAVVDSVRLINYFDIPKEFRWPHQYDIGPALSVDVKIINPSDTACVYDRFPLGDTCTMLPISMAVEYKFMAGGKEYHVDIKDLAMEDVSNPNCINTEENGMDVYSFPPGESMYYFTHAGFLIKAGYLPVDFDNFRKHSNLKRILVARKVEKLKEEIVSTIEFKFYFNYVSPVWEYSIPPSLIPEYNRQIEKFPQPPSGPPEITLIF